jgi:hypothetical protein
MSDIDIKYNQLGGSSSFLGKPKTEEKTCPDGVGHYRHYEFGSIYWTPKTGAHEIHGNIHIKWSKLGWEKSVLGYPLTDEKPTPIKKGRYQQFQFGFIHSYDKGTYETHGAIQAKWQSLNWENGILGFPVTDELSTPDGIGRYNHFEGGTIYWTTKTGAHEVHGGIRARWSQQGWERGKLGYPISDELSTPSGYGRFSRFQGGSIYWSPIDGTRVVLGPNPYYIFAIHNFEIFTTRAVHEDTDFVNANLEVNDKIVWQRVRSMGDVNDGLHIVNLESFPIPIEDSDTCVFAFQILNSGHEDYPKIEEGIKIGADALLKAVGASAIWQTFGKWLTEALIDIFTTNCDGPVAAKRIPQDFPSYSGEDLKSQCGANGHVETNRFVIESQTGCGDSPDYNVTWSMFRLI